MAIAYNHPDVVTVILEQKGENCSLKSCLPFILCLSLKLLKCCHYSNSTNIKILFCLFKANALHATNNLQIIPDFSLKDSREQTVLALALWTGKVVLPLCNISFHSYCMKFRHCIWFNFPGYNDVFTVMQHETKVLLH